MDQTPKKDQQRNGVSTTKTPMKKGLFADGIWHCNCEPRMPADHFQTKNGGPNHGRWFYTCQKPQPRRCGFFLWDNEAKTREARAVLANSHTEPEASGANMPGNTPVKTPLTPQSVSRSALRSNQFAFTRFPAEQSPTRRDDDWLHVSEDDLDGAMLFELAGSEVVLPQEAASKSVKNKLTDSPSKRNHEGYQERIEARPVYPRPTAELDLFNTPNQNRSRGLFSGNQTHPQTRPTDQIGGLLSPGDTSRTNRFTNIYDDLERIPAARDESPTARKSTNVLESNTKLKDSPLLTEPTDEEIQMTTLAKQILDVLKDEAPEMTDNTAILNSVKSIALQHTREFENVKRGRDACRKVIERQKTQIAELEKEVAKLKRTGGK